MLELQAHGTGTMGQWHSWVGLGWGCSDLWVPLELGVSLLFMTETEEAFAQFGEEKPKKLLKPGFWMAGVSLGSLGGGGKAALSSKARLDRVWSILV